MMGPFRQNPNALQLYVVTFGASDIAPGKYAVREQTVAGGTIANGDAKLADTLEAVRSLVPPWAGYNLGRMPGDDPVIVEVWI